MRTFFDTKYIIWSSPLKYLERRQREWVTISTVYIHYEIDLFMQKGRKVHQLTSVLDVQNLSYQRHYHWPSIQRFREVQRVM